MQIPSASRYGRAGQIGYAPPFPDRVRARCSGKTSGHPQLLEPAGSPRRKPRWGDGLDDELEDCAFPLMAGMTGGGDPRAASRRDFALWSARDRAAPAWSARRCGKREDYSRQRKALDCFGRAKSCAVVGNPANTNAYIAMKSAPSLPKKNFTAMLPSRSHNRALSQSRQIETVGSIGSSASGQSTRPLYADTDRDRRRHLGKT